MSQDAEALGHGERQMLDRRDEFSIVFQMCEYPNFEPRATVPNVGWGNLKGTISRVIRVRGTKSLGATPERRVLLKNFRKVIHGSRTDWKWNVECDQGKLAVSSLLDR